MEQDIYLIRHGETEWSLSGRHTGITDLELTEKGKEQASFLGRKLPSFDLVISSPRLRAVETCRGAGVRRFIEDPDAVEWDYGSYEGLKSSEIEKKHPGWNLFVDGAPGGECPATVAARADRLLQSVRGKGRVAIFSHGHFLRMVAARWLGLKPEQGALFSLSVASISILSFEHRKPVLRLWNESV